METLTTIALLVLAPYWLGPLMLKFKQRRSATPEPMHPTRNIGEVPPLLAPFVVHTQRALAGLGFRNFAVLRNSLGVALLADSESGAIATGLALPKPDGTVNSLVVFTTRLSTGHRLDTTNASLPAITPDRAGEFCIRLPRERDLVRLHAIHAERVTRATLDGAIPEPVALGDALSYQMGEEAASVSHAVASGYWRRRGDQLALTWKGAFLSAWRLLPPWRELRWRSDERRVQSLGLAQR